MTAQLPLGKNYETNPYAAGVPDGVQSLSQQLFDYLRTQQIQLRQQHNITQAGDSTFSWNDLTQLTNLPLYNLGSLGRFVHPTYGIITARYVQFTTPGAGVATGGPVGFAQSTTGFSWKATTQLANSTILSLVGLQAAYSREAEGQYGWVIVNGVNLQDIVFVGATKPTVGTEVVWFDDFQVQSNTTGNVLGVIVSDDQITEVDSTHWTIPPGAFRVDPHTQTPPPVTTGAGGGLTQDQFTELAMTMLSLIVCGGYVTTTPGSGGGGGSGGSTAIPDDVNWVQWDSATTDYLAAVNAAIANCKITGQALGFYPGKTYPLSGPINASDFSLSIVATDATLLALTNQNILNLNATITQVQAITSITYADTYDYSLLGSPITTVSSILVPDGTKYAVNDICKVVSEDYLVGTDPTLFARCGEYARIGAISGNTLYLTAQLRDTYATSPRIGKMNKAVAFRVTGGIYAQADPVNFTSALINVTSAYGFTITDAKCFQAGGTFIQTNSNYAERMERIFATNLLNSTGTGHFGYAILANSGEMGVYTQIYGENNRHTWTSGTTQTPAGNDLLRKYGRSRGWVVSDSTAVACGGACFDTHQDSEDGLYSNITTYGAQRGNNGSGAGINIRGRRIRVHNHTDIGSFTSLSVTGNYANQTSEIDIDDCKSYNSLLPLSIDGSLTCFMSGIRVRNHVVHGGAGTIWHASFADVQFWNPQLISYATADGQICFSPGMQATFRVYGGTYDFRPSANANHVFSNPRDATANFYSYNPSVLINAGQLKGWGSSNTGTWQGVGQVIGNQFTMTVRTAGFIVLGMELTDSVTSVAYGILISQSAGNLGDVGTYTLDTTAGSPSATEAFSGTGWISPCNCRIINGQSNLAPVVGSGIISGGNLLGFDLLVGVDDFRAGGFAAVNILTLAAGNNTITTGGAGNDRVIFRCLCNSSGIVINNISTGPKYDGQFLLLGNHYQSTNNLTLQHNSSGKILFGTGPTSTLVIPPGKALLLTGLFGNWVLPVMTA